MRRRQKEKRIRKNRVKIKRVHIKILTWKKESYGVYNLNVSKADIITNHFFMYSNSIFLLDNKNQAEMIYVVKRFIDNKYTRKLKKFALVFNFETEALRRLNLGNCVLGVN